MGHTGNHFRGVLLAGVVQTRGLVPKLANWSSKGLLVYRDIARPLYRDIARNMVSNYQMIQETKIGALRPPDLSPLRKQNVRLKF